LAQSAATEAVFLRRHGLLSGVRCRRSGDASQGWHLLSVCSSKGNRGSRAEQGRRGKQSSTTAVLGCSVSASAALLVELGGSSRCDADGGPAGWARAASASVAPASCGAAALAFGGSVSCVCELELGVSHARVGSAHGEGKGCARASSQREAELVLKLPVSIDGGVESHGCLAGLL